MHKAYWLGSVLLVLLSMGASATEVGLVTAVAGNVKLQEEKSVASELKPFVKVREGDRLMMESNARLQVVYFEGGRQETWSGRGALEVGSVSSKAIKGTMQPEIKTLPAILVKQLAKTPAQDDHVKTGMIRMRSMPPYDKLETVEKNYDEMRKQAVAGDLNPELYLLASYFELREFDKLEALLRQLNEKASEAHRSWPP
ncbi:MAG: hypothetical protein IPP84_06110 [Propionivibrio sp.]|uniref:hypothetical protein n=1 Tax=Propionivibrio sp. TaxID=2212460 RepID=UPI0025E63332|nr:hypothetical protein [Propionivibrio sp.]MBL0207546.1 hypothetical protein [Propionivibrio sp.]